MVRVITNIIIFYCDCLTKETNLSEALTSNLLMSANDQYVGCNTCTRVNSLFPSLKYPFTPHTV